MESITMVDLNRWYECRTEKPKNKGKYLLLVCVPDRLSGHSNIGVIESWWNGKTWDIKEEYRTMRWKYTRPGEINKYPDFVKNNQKIRL